MSGSRRPGTWTARLVALLLLLVGPVELLLGCGSGEVAVSVVRFDEAAIENPAPLVTIDGETRPSFRSYRKTSLTRRLAFPVPQDGRAVLDLPLPSVLHHAAEVVVGAWVRPPKGDLASVAAQRSPVSEERRVALHLEIPHPGERVQLHVAALEVPPAEAEANVIETRTVGVPAGAYLGIGLGILPAVERQSPVTFRVLACSKACRVVFSEALDPGRAEGRGWQDRRVDLGGLAGQSVRLRFETEREGPGADGFSFPVWSLPAIYAPSGHRRPDLVLISIDTLRADHLPTYGYSRDTSPFIEEGLARRGVVFERCMSSATTTGPSHMTMFTSLQPSVHGVRGNTGRRPLVPGAVTLAETLRAHGYDTAAFTENGAIALHRGFARGFDVYREDKNPLLRSDGVERTLAGGLEWLQRRRHRQVFLFLHTYQVHEPYAPPAAYRDLFRGDGLDAHPDLPPDWHPDLYDREIRYTDDQLRAFVEEANRHGLLDNAIVVLTSDHGEAFLEHGFLAHGADIHQPVLRVPLVFSGPGLPRGQRIDAPVGLVDLMPTLLDLAGVPKPPRLMGVSFADLVRGVGDPAPFWRRPLFSEGWRGMGVTARGPVAVAQPTFAVLQGNRKMIRYRDGEGFRYVFYDLEQDPMELQDRFIDGDPESAELRELLDRYPGVAAELEAGFEDRDPETDSALDADPERLEKLRALGYIE